MKKLKKAVPITAADYSIQPQKVTLCMNTYEKISRALDDRSAFYKIDNFRNVSESHTYHCISSAVVYSYTFSIL